jgi:hypothetical protein
MGVCLWLRLKREIPGVEVDTGDGKLRAFRKVLEVVVREGVDFHIGVSA